MNDQNFFDQSSEASDIKIRIVTKYFKFWATVISKKVKNSGKKMAYYDLFSGPGKYEDGTDSTPTLILKAALKDPLITSQLITVFNDSNTEYSISLKENIASIPEIENLQHQPKIHNLEALKAYEDYIEPLGQIPSFTFIDPFGYKNVTQRLLEGVLTNWGCDLLLFFNYNRINAAITNNVFDDHMTNLFGRNQIQLLRTQVRNRAPHERVTIVLESFAQALKHKGFKYVLPFEFSRPDMKKISHHLVFVTKSEFAYSVMKEIMAQESSEEIQGVPSFKYTKSLTKDETPLLYLLAKPIEELGDSLLDDFKNQHLSCLEVYKKHHIGRPYLLKNYKAALLQLELEDKIKTNPPAKARRMHKGRRTFGNNVQIWF